MSDVWPDEITARIAAEIKRLREKVLDVSGQWLSDRTEELGHRVSRSTISEIETGRRKSITVADLIVLAAALDTSPIALIYPGPYRSTARILPKLEQPQIWGVRWFTGDLLLGGKDRDRSEVPFDDGGHYVLIPNAEQYNENLRALSNAREAAILYDRKAAMWRELNLLRHYKTTGERPVSDEQIQTITNAIADYQIQIDNLVPPLGGDEGG